MSLRYFILAGVSVAAISTISAPASAGPAATVSANQWYTVGFGSTANGASSSSATVGNALGGRPVLPFGTGSHGPILPSGFASAATPVTAKAWTIDAPNGGYITITDVEFSGDQFQLTDNGTLMTATTGALGGQAGLTSGLTSTPTIGGECGENISCALSNGSFSSGTFALTTGSNVISATEFAETENASAGDANFIIELNSPDNNNIPAPEPVSLSLLGVGVAGLSAVRRRKRRA